MCSPRWNRLVLGIVVLVGIVACRFSVAADARPLTFENDVVPLLEARCIKCHGGKERKGNLDLRRRFAILKGGDSGAAIVPGKPDESVLIERIVEGTMPPKEEGRLDEKQLSLLKAWVAGGALIATKEEPPLDVADAVESVKESDRQFWSFQPPLRSAIPFVKDAGRARTPIDRFLLAKLEEKGLSFNPDADRLVLLRRLCFDLHGLPPTLEQIERFANDDRPDACERLVDELLDSPRYGERWGRHWLDVAGYADSDGYLEADRERPEAWRYRDYVIRSFNADKPYDRFLLEQVAGDELFDWRRAAELTPEMEDALIATGFLRTAADGTYVGYKEKTECYKVMADTVQIVSSALMGVTLQCARCHAHKSDPFTQRDYYQLHAILLASYDPDRWLASGERAIPFATDAQQAAVAEHNRKVDERIAPFNTELAALRKTYREKSADEKLDDKALVAKFPEFKTELERINAAVAAENAQRRAVTQIRGLLDLDGPVTQGRVLRRGDYANLGANVEPGLPAVLVPVGYEYKPDAGYKTSGRRLAFAKWLVDPRNPLTARVHVNRVWAHHFGRGLVATVDQFGRSGELPTHPELLDWLALEFCGGEGEKGSGGVAVAATSSVNLSPDASSAPPPPASSPSSHSTFNPQPSTNTWSQKRLHRLIVLSTAYRQSSGADPKKLDADPDNLLLGAWRPRRHQGEVVRDTLLTLAGKLREEMSGPPTPIALQGDGQVTTNDDPAGNRRTVYLKVRRSQHVTLLDLFDTPRMEVNCPQRSEAIVATQALTLSNSRFVETTAEAFARRIRETAGADESARIDLAWRLVYTRPSAEADRQNVREFLDAAIRERLGDKYAAATAVELQQARDAAWQHIALALFNSNEFLFAH